MAAHSDEATRALQSHEWLQRVPPVDVPASIAAWDLGGGETAVLSWAAAHPGSIAILDDYAARTCALVLQVPVVGTLGLALRLRVQGGIPEARPLIEELRRAGLYLSDHVIEQALALVGESD